MFIKIVIHYCWLFLLLKEFSLNTAKGCQNILNPLGRRYSYSDWSTLKLKVALTALTGQTGASVLPKLEGKVIHLEKVIVRDRFLWPKHELNVMSSRFCPLAEWILEMRPLKAPSTQTVRPRRSREGERDLDCTKFKDGVAQDSSGQWSCWASRGGTAGELATAGEDLFLMDMIYRWVLFWPPKILQGTCPSGSHPMGDSLAQSSSTSLQEILQKHLPVGPWCQVVL